MQDSTARMMIEYDGIFSCSKYYSCTYFFLCEIHSGVQLAHTIFDKACVSEGKRAPIFIIRFYCATRIGNQPHAVATLKTPMMLDNSF